MSKKEEKELKKAAEVLRSMGRETGSVRPALTSAMRTASSRPRFRTDAL